MTWWRKSKPTGQHGKPRHTLAEWVTASIAIVFVGGIMVTVIVLIIT